MKLDGYKVRPVTYKEAKEFTRVWHYSGTCPPSGLYYGLYYPTTELVGVAVYGAPAMRNQSKCYGADIELRRLCCIDLTPPNTESYFIAITLRLLRRLNFKRVLSLADPEHGHSGAIYRAANFIYQGVERGGGSRKIFIDGKPIHSRTAYAKYGASGLRGLQEALPRHKIEVVNSQRKHVFTFDL